MKKILSLMLVAMMCVTLCIGASASEVTENVIRIDNVEVIFESTSTLSMEEKQAIAAYLVYGESDAQAYGLMCTLFGHKNTTEYVTTISHGVLASGDRCLEQIWQLNICSRCDNVEQILVGEQYISCCP